MLAGGKTVKSIPTSKNPVRDVTLTTKLVKEFKKKASKAAKATICGNDSQCVASEFKKSADKLPPLFWKKLARSCFTGRLGRTIFRGNKPRLRSLKPNSLAIMKVKEVYKKAGLGPIVAAKPKPPKAPKAPTPPAGGSTTSVKSLVPASATTDKQKADHRLIDQTWKELCRDQWSRTQGEVGNNASKKRKAQFFCARKADGTPDTNRFKNPGERVQQIYSQKYYNELPKFVQTALNDYGITPAVYNAASKRWGNTRAIPGGTAANTGGSTGTGGATSTGGTSGTGGTGGTTPTTKPTKPKKEAKWKTGGFIQFTLGGIFAGEACSDWDNPVSCKDQNNLQGFEGMAEGGILFTKGGMGLSISALLGGSRDKREKDISGIEVGQGSQFIFALLGGLHFNLDKARKSSIALKVGVGGAAHLKRPMDPNNYSENTISMVIPFSAEFAYEVARLGKMPLDILIRVGGGVFPQAIDLKADENNMGQEHYRAKGWWIGGGIGLRLRFGGGTEEVKDKKKKKKGDAVQGN
jgi:hypothetical protein